MASATAREAHHHELGVRVTVEELRALRRRVGDLGLDPAEVVAGLFPGAYRSVFLGRGLDFHEVRAYQPGDDFRTLDWRVTARTGELHTKVFREERERSVYLVADGGPAMHFGTRGAFKWVAGARLAALVAWIAVAAGEKVAGLVFGQGRSCPGRLPAGGEPGAMGLLALLAAVHRREGPDGCGLVGALARVRRLARPGSLVLVVSDFRHLDDEARRLLTRLSRHHALAAALVSDPLERALPPAGLYPMGDGVRTLLVDSADRSLVEAFRTRQAARRDAALALFRGLGAQIVELGTDQDPVQRLRVALGWEG